MIRKTKQALVVCLIAVITAITCSSAHAQKQPAGEIEQPVKRETRYPFRGKIESIDKMAKTIALVGKEKPRIIHVNDETRFVKDGQAASLKEAMPGDAIAGLVTKKGDGKELAISIRLGEKPGRSSQAKSPRGDGPGEDEP